MKKKCRGSNVYLRLVPFVNSQVRHIKLALFMAVTLDAKDERQQHLACMLAKQVADNTSSGPINVLPRQMKGETFQPHEILVIGTGDRTAVTFTEQLPRLDSWKWKY